MTRGLALVHATPCESHPCDGCRLCLGGRCCRGDNPDYALPVEGSWQPVIGRLGIMNDDGDRQECHCCGRWFAFLGKHVWATHDVTANEYRSAFGLAHGQPLAGSKKRDEARRVAMRVFPPYFTKNGDRFATISRERRTLLSSRPNRRQVRASRLTERRELVKAATAASIESRKSIPSRRVAVTCVGCGCGLLFYPSEVARGYVRCGRCSLEHKRISRIGVPPANAKLTIDDARAIREMYRKSGLSQRVIGRQFGVSQTLVSLIVQRRLWPEPSE